jgi:hypothetical protein
LALTHSGDVFAATVITAPAPTAFSLTAQPEVCYLHARK